MYYIRNVDEQIPANGTENAVREGRRVTIATQVKDVKIIDPKDISYDYEHVLDLIGFGKTQWLVLLDTGLILMMVINETVGINMINIAAQCDFGMNSVDKAVLSASSFIGILISSYIWGYFSDTMGRRKVLIYSIFSANLMSCASMFAPNYWVFVGFRLVVGILLAAASSTIYAYLGEFYTARLRPVMNNYAGMFVGVAMVYIPGIAWFVLSLEGSIHITDSFELRPWRLLIFFNFLPGFIAALILLMLPESPKLLLSLLRQKEAYSAVNWMCTFNTGFGLEHLHVHKLKVEETSSMLADKDTNVVKKMWFETIPLFKPPYVGNFLNTCFIMCGLFFCGTGMGLWFPEIQNRLGLFKGNDEPLTVCEVLDAAMESSQQEGTETFCNDEVSVKSLTDSLWVGLSYVIGFIFLGPVLKFVGRKSVICCILCGSFGFGLALQWITEPIGISVCFCLFIMLPGLMVSVLNSVVVDLMPTHLRGKAMCLVMMLGRSGSIIGSNIIGVLLESNCTFTFYLFSGMMLLGAGLTLLIPI